MIVYKKGLVDRLLKIDLVRFCLVGALGFTINLILLTLLYRTLHSPLFLAQIVAAEIALFSNFLFHHHWTYKANTVRKTISTLIVQFHITSWLAVVGSAIVVSIGVHVFKLSYVVALVIASAIALLWNFSWSKFVIWRHHDEESAYSHKTKEEAS